jgi:hypothetical protein
MTWVLLTFVVTTVIYAALLALAFHRVARHMQGNPEGMRAVTEHVLVPLLGKQQNEPDEKS